MIYSRKEYERNMYLLSEQFRLNRISINIKNKYSIRGIKNARIAPNRRANLNTVDDSARLMANMVARIRENPKDFSD